MTISNETLPNEKEENPSDHSEEINEHTQAETEDNSNDDSEESSEKDVSESEESSEDSNEQADELIHADDPKGVQKRINKAVARQKSAEAETQAMRDKLQKIEQAIAQQRLDQLKITHPETGQPLQEPQKGDFENPADYLDAWIEYGKAKSAADNRAYAEAQNFKNMQTKMMAFESRQNLAKEKYEDYDAIVDESLPVSPEMGEVLLDNKNAPDILYYLGKNRSEAKRLYELSQQNPALAAYEIGKIESSLNVPKKMKSSAPPPIKKTGSTGSAYKSVDNMTLAEMQEYLRGP